MKIIHRQICNQNGQNGINHSCRCSFIKTSRRSTTEWEHDGEQTDGNWVRTRARIMGKYFLSDCRKEKKEPLGFTQTDLTFKTLKEIKEVLRMNELNE